MGSVFEYIYDNHGKGVTAYRDGTRSKQVLTTRKDNKEFAEEADADAVLDAVEENISDEWFRQELAELLMDTAEEDLTPAEFAQELGMGVVGSGEEVIPTPRERGKVLYGRTEKIETGYGNIYVTVNEDEEGLVEVFAQIGKSGGFMNSFTESVSRLISVGLRSGIPPEDIIDHLEDIRSPKIAWDEGDKIQSIPDAISTAMARYLESESRIQALRAQGIDPEDRDGSSGRGEGSDGDSGLLENIVDDEEDADAVSLNGQGDTGEDDDDSKGIIESGESPECPECGAFELYYSEGCKTCESCGWSEC
jgi:ribonucleoside-diphosphate reductase alpha chain